MYSGSPSSIMNNLGLIDSSLLSRVLTQTCRTSFSFYHLKKIHSLLITCGLSGDAVLLKKLFHGALPSAFRTGFWDLPYTSAIINQIGGLKISKTSLWNSLIQMSSSSSEPQMSSIFFTKMRQDGIFPNQHTFPLLLKALSNAKNAIMNPLQVYAQLLKFGFGCDHFVQNSLVSAFSNCGSIDFARQVFNEIPLKDSITWTAMINGYLKMGLAAKALEVFIAMRLDNVRVDEVTVVSILRAAAMVGNVWLGKSVHGVYIESGNVVWDVYVGSALLDMYSKCGCCEDARKVFDEMPDRNLVSWSALIAGYSQCHRFKEAILVFQEMHAQGVEPNQCTLSSVLSACASLGALDQGIWVHKYLDASKMKISPQLGTSLIDMYAKCGCIQQAFLVFDKMTPKSVYIWTAIINGFAIHGDATNSLDLFSQMLSRGIQPNKVTLIAVLSACSHEGLVEKGCEIFNSMNQDYGLEPNVDHYGCMIDLLGRAGYLDEAVNLIKTMPMEPTPGVWGALFGACMIHKAYELGECIGKHLIELQPNHSGRYALLANLYARCSNWDGVTRIRNLMKERGVNKSIGCSWFELDGVIHEFTSFNKSHTESKTIYSILDSILDSTHSFLDTDLVLYDS